MHLVFFLRAIIQERQNFIIRPCKLLSSLCAIGYIWIFFCTLSISGQVLEAGRLEHVDFVLTRHGQKNPWLKSLPDTPLCLGVACLGFLHEQLGTEIKTQEPDSEILIFGSVSDAADAQLFNTREAELESRCSLQDPAVSVAPKCS